MKLIYWVLIIIAGALFPILFMIVVPILILEKSWWWLGGTAIVELIIGLIVFAIVLFLRLRKKAPEKIKLSVKRAKERAIYEMKIDTDNPDNFKINKAKLERWGEKGAEKTPILILDGMGTELNQRRCVIMNLNNPKQESTWLTDPSDEEIRISVKLMAEHPPEEEIREERIGYEGGMPVTRITTRRPSMTEKKQEEQEKKAEEVGAL